MKKIGIIVFVVCIVVGLAFANLFSFGRIGESLFSFKVNFKGVHGSGNVATEHRDVSDFSAVDVSGVFQVEIVAGKDFSVDVQADDNLIQYVTTEVRGETLRIGLDKKVSTRNDLIVRVTAPSIEKLQASGASKVSAIGISGDSFTLDASGASRVTVVGATSSLSVDVSGASNIDADELTAVNANVDASGASHVYVNVSGELHAEASGASRVVYSGDPKSVDNRQSGAGTVSRK